MLLTVVPKLPGRNIGYHSAIDLWVMNEDPRQLSLPKRAITGNREIAISNFLQVLGWIDK